MANIKFSIIIPVYNVAPYLRECLDSVLSQTYTQWEAICVDDGSTDGSGGILDEYASHDNRFRVVHKCNEGVSVARNVALELVSGEWVGFLDSDDAILASWLQTVQSAINVYNPDYLRLGFTKWYGNPGYPKMDVKSVRTDVVNDNAWGWKLFPDGGWAWVGFVKTDVLRKSCAQFPVGMRLSEDSIFNLKLIPYITKCCYLEYAGYLYRMRGASAVFARRGVDDCVRFCAELNALWNVQKAYISVCHIEECRKATTMAIVHSIVVWERIKKDEGGGECLQVVNVLHDCIRDGCFATKYVSPTWRIAFKFVVSSGSFWFMSFENAVVRIIRKFLIRPKWSL